MAPPVPVDEAERLQALHDLDILDTEPEAAYDDLVQLAAAILHVPMATISLVDERRQWFKSQVGLPVPETSRDISFCGHTILEPEIMVVPDATLDARFRENPLVTGALHLRFYAGVPLTTEDGFSLGALCVLDSQPRHLTDTEQAALRVLARQVVAHFQIRRQVVALEKAAVEREEIQRRLELSRQRLREANHKLKQLAATDALTGLYNRRAFDLYLRREWRLSARRQKPLGLLAIDLDHFKRINDTYGHADGDRVLKKVAQVLQEQVRGSDVVARLGGEEFAVLLPGTGQEDAAHVAEGLRAAVEAELCGGHRVTVSIGVAAGTNLARSEECLLLPQADAALYVAKGAGRNRVA
ncbi:diguanylate cyclase [Silvibacterium sp.]|uniref:GGDEF domain-containing protein n=1 Tax=Silvibacterium sp. TaxID=1964179 RepID=UPI0039E5FB73